MSMSEMCGSYLLHNSVKLYYVLSLLSNFVNGSKCWVVAIASSMIYQPVGLFLCKLTQKNMFIQTTKLSRPKLRGKDIFEDFDFEKEDLMQLLVDDIGGIGIYLDNYALRCSCSVDSQNPVFMYQPAAGLSFQGAFLCLEDSDKGFFHEFHLVTWSDPLSVEQLAIKKEIFVEDDDLVVLYCIGQVVQMFTMS
ncbi:Crinkler (CRN) [Phytophthora megakarya]|uniref:Crinkler (CRN) n=1 Tax=Phytophthora megakarya TaxID=4795 RepID=A0A225UE75_9STRA|nr:Crinkler (CRN) [Phytophthora megakarya]